MLKYFAILGGVCLSSCGLIAEDWPQWLGKNRDGTWTETQIIEKFPSNGPKVLWRAEVGLGYAGPAVQAGHVVLNDMVPTAKVASSVRGLSGVERTLCFDEVSGNLKWKHEYPVVYKIQYPSGPRCTPTIDGQRVYTLGAMGNLNCYELDSGKVIWQKDLVKDFQARISIWGFASHPLVDGEKLICLVGGTGERAIMAFNKLTGEVLWTSQGLESDIGYCPPVIYDFNGRRTLVIWHSRAVIGLDPETGKRLWNYPWIIKAALTTPMPRKLDGDRLFLTSFYEGPVMLRINSSTTPEVVWKGKGKGEMPDKTDGLHSIMPTPYIRDGHIYGVCSYGELRCLKADTGERIWETRKPTVGRPDDEGKPVRWGNAFLTPNEDKWFLFNEQGELIIARLSPQGYQELDRTLLLKPLNKMAGRPVVWSHPAYANKSIFVRNDEELIRVNLSAAGD